MSVVSLCRLVRVGVVDEVLFAPVSGMLSVVTHSQVLFELLCTAQADLARACPSFFGPHAPQLHFLATILVKMHSMATAVFYMCSFFRISIYSVTYALVKNRCKCHMGPKKGLFQRFLSRAEVTL